MATIDVTEATFEETVTKGGIVLVDVWASWCGPCVRFAPTFEKVSEAHPEAVFAKLDSEANQGLAAALQIQSIPTLMIFRDGILMFRESGSMSAAALEDLYTQVSELDMEQVRKEMAKEQKAEGERD
ncbi:MULTISPECIES: thioredoxin family protein [unclassified Corynebacterium]|uniref:thioredoxin family protein n=1 Tax=unclassified Corynebacterium TaxID=2624378 RepID=UPI00352398B8